MQLEAVFGYKLFSSLEEAATPYDARNRQTRTSTHTHITAQHNSRTRPKMCTSTRAHDTDPFTASEE